MPRDNHAGAPVIAAPGDPKTPALSLSGRTALAAGQALSGERRGLKAILPFAGPAVLASVAYMDPGNFATNIQAGARYQYELLWVVVLANAVAMLFQALSAKLGIVTGRNLAELCRLHFPRPLVFAMWAVSEAAAMATDLAEFLGAAIGLSLLFGLALWLGMAIAAIATYAILAAQKSGFRPIELLIGALICVIGVSYLTELIIAPPDWRAVALHSVLPRITDSGALTLAVGIVGATVMPHAIYLHSGITQARVPTRDDAERRRLVRFSNREVVLALGLAGLVNMAMVAMAATAFHDGVHNGVAEIAEAYHTLVPLLGVAAGGVFLASLIASGLSSSVVGTMAGQIVMQGFVGFRIPVWLRRLVTMVPAFIVIAAGVDATAALVWSQVALSLALPVPMIALLVFTGRPDIMGGHVNRRWVGVAAATAAGSVMLLNAWLIVATLGGPSPI